VYVPVDGNCHQGEHTSAYGQHGNELADLAVGRAERPVAGQHIAKVYGHVECRHHGVRDGQVHQKVVGHVPHPLVGHDYPNDDQIAARGHHDHWYKQHRPRQLVPPWQLELVAVGPRHAVSSVTGRVWPAKIRFVHGPLRNLRKIDIKQYYYRRYYTTRHQKQLNSNDSIRTIITSKGQ